MTQNAEKPSLTEDSDALAREYDRVSVDRQFLSGKMLVRDLAVAPGERALDVGCGTGLLAQHIADLVGPTGYVLGVDPLPLRIELAQAKARPNLQFKVADAYDLSSLPAAGEVRPAPRVCSCPEARRATGHQQQRKGSPYALPGARVGGVGSAAVQCLCKTKRRADPSRRRAGDAPVVDGGRLRGEVDRRA